MALTLWYSLFCLWNFCGIIHYKCKEHGLL